MLKGKIIKGDIYQFPKKDEGATLDKHLTNRIEAAKRLYNIFNLKNANKIPDEIKQFNTLLLEKTRGQSKIRDRQAIKEYNIKKSVDAQGKEVEEYASEIMNTYLRKSLRKHRALFIEVFAWFCDRELFHKKMQEPEIDEKLDHLIEILNADFNREKQKIEWAKSIKNQAVRVQVEKASNRLALASYLSQKEQKQDIFEFLKVFAKESNGSAFDNLVKNFIGEKEAYEAWLGEAKKQSMQDDKMDWKALKKELLKYSCSRYKEICNKEYLGLYAKIQDEFESYIQKRGNLNEDKLAYDRLRKMLSTKLRIFLMYKFVDIGKAVYHFCDIKDNTCNIKEEYKNGITSFHYEMIRAEERIEQNLSASLVYSIHHFSQAVMKELGENGGQDILTINEKGLKEEMETRKIFKENADLQSDLLRFWGGRSQFEDVVGEAQGFDLFKELKNCLYSLRNRNFHYGKGEEKNTSYPILEKIIQRDKDRYTRLMLEKYQHNNIFAFFHTDKIIEILQRLHSKEKFTAKFIPAFATFFKKNDIVDFINKNSIQLRSENREQYQGALYFLLKKIYYYEFLRNENSKEYFSKAIVKYEKEMSVHQPKTREDKKKEAWKNFKNTIDLHKSLPEICQSVLIAYSLQNQDFLRDKTANGDQEAFKHYKMILNDLMHLAFESYIQEKYYSSLLENKNPYFNEDAVKPEFLNTEKFSNVSLKEFEGLLDTENKLLYEFYVMAKFLQPRQLNFLIGDIEGYIQYVSDIHNRAGSEMKSEKDEKIKNFRSILQVLRFCMVSNGQISGDWKDYYKDSHEFARHLRNYVAIPEMEKSKKGFDYDDLEDFLKDVSLSDDKAVMNKLYIDGKNPIIFRGIELSRMYGVESVLSKAYSKHRVTIADLDKLKKLRNEINEQILPKKTTDFGGEVQKSLQAIKNLSFDDTPQNLNLPKNEEEFRNQRKYQNHRGKVELFDIQEYSNIIFDLYTPLIQWCYLWERDNLYYLLGYYYVKQFWAKDKTMYQAMLQNIYNAYHYGKTVELRKEFMPEGTGEALVNLTFSSSLISSKKVRIEKWLGIEFEVVEGYLFGKVVEKGFNLRNNIDHFHYFYGKDGKSFLELYERMYQRLKYDRKLQNNVIQRIEDILQRYHLRTKVVWADKDKLSFQKPKSLEEKGRRKEEKQKEHKKESDCPIESDIFTMKKEGKSFTADARTKEFCQVAQTIGEFKV